MPCKKINNNSDLDLGRYKHYLDSFIPYTQKVLGYNKPFVLNFQSDQENSKKALGRTAFYDPNTNEVTIYVDGRHIKDIMRSIAHELVHHTQNCRGEFEGGCAADDGYAQTDSHLRGMEREAYEKGNMLFRDWEDGYKRVYGENIMKIKIKILREEIKKQKLDEVSDRFRTPTAKSGEVEKEKFVKRIYNPNDPRYEKYCKKLCRNQGMSADPAQATSKNECGCYFEDPNVFVGPPLPGSDNKGSGKKGRPSCKKVLRRGCRGKSVESLQKKLKELGYTIDVDGAYGPGTARVVKQFQKDTEGLKVDGMAGPNTLKALNAVTMGDRKGPTPAPQKGKDTTQKKPVAKSSSSIVDKVKAAGGHQKVYKNLGRWPWQAAVKKLQDKNVEFEKAVETVYSLKLKGTTGGQTDQRPLMNKLRTMNVTLEESTINEVLAENKKKVLGKKFDDLVKAIKEGK